MVQTKGKQYRHISQEERVEIYCFLREGLSDREIGRRLGRHHTTIGREIDRNSIDYGFDKLKYKPIQAEKKYLERKQKANKTHVKLIKNHSLRTKIFSLLRDKEKDWGPDEILGRLKEEGWKVVSTPTLYRYIHKVGWSNFLLHKEKGYKKKYESKKKGGMYKDVPLITERSKENELREEIGHRENDTIISSGKGGLVTSVDRKSRYLNAMKTSDFKGETVYGVMKYMLYNEDIKSLTIDNGVEFAKIREFRRKGIEIYRCNTYASYEKGTNERTNGLIRRYIPKGCDISKYTNEEIENIVKILNHKPRKILGYRTPHEIHFNTHLSYIT